MAGDSIRVISGNATGSQLAVEGELLIGRASPGEGSLDGDPELSRQHARISRGAGGALVIEDLGSTNGTYVNSARISGPTQIGPGDKVFLGSTTLEVAGVEPAGAAQAPVPGVGPPPVEPTRVNPTPVAPAAPPPPAPEPPSGPPPGMTGPPPGMTGPPPGMTGPPPGIPAGMAGGPAAMMARMKRRMLMIGVGGFVVGFALAALIFNLLL